MKVSDVNGRWPSVLSALGIPDEYLRNKHGPCPMCGGKDRYRFDNKDGDGRYFCNGCGAGDGVMLLQGFHGWDFKTAMREVERVVGTAEYNKPEPVNWDERRKWLRAVSKRCQPAGDTVRAYLAERGLEPTRAIKQAPIKYAGGDTYDCMVCTVYTPDGEPLTLHRTYLDGAKKADVDSPKRLMPKVKECPHGAIRLWPAAETMGIAEGIETALSANRIHNMPVWSVVSDGGVQHFTPPPECKTLVIFGDNDESYAGQAAAYAAAKRLTRDGYRVLVEIPDKQGDWNDVLRAASKKSQPGATCSTP